jgi:hypothetical protein
MKGFDIDGIPIKLFTATSKAEAVELSAARLVARSFHTSASRIDVVMETHRAGLELCQYIRETLRNRLTQI